MRVEDSHLAGVTFEVEGGFTFNDLAAALEGVEDRLLGQLDEAVAESAGVAVSQAQADVRVDSGDLQESIEAHRVGWGHQVVTAGEGLGYAARIEALDPYFNPSIEQARDDLRRRVLSVGLRR